MKTILIFILFLGVPGWAQSQIIPKTCGTFSVEGWIELNDGWPELVVYKDSMSEVRLELDKKSAFRALPYKDQAVRAIVTILKPILKYRGMVHSSENISLRSGFGPRPGEITDGFELISARACVKN